nr:hypothetical protein [Tanacetum cinerariifolium]
MHNNIMAAGSRDRPPMLATGRFAQWKARFLKYIDTRPNDDALRKCTLEGPYKLTIVTISAVPTTDDTPTVLEQTTIDTLLAMSSENKAHYKSEKEAIYLLLTGIGDEIYSTEVNEIRAERITKNANLLALVVAASPYQDPYYQAPKSQKPYAPTSKQSSFTRSNASTKFKGKEISKPITPLSESASKKDNWRFRNQRTVTAVGARETVGSQIDQNAVECDDERVVLANLIANLKLDVDKNKKIQKQSKKANISLAHDLQECKSILVETSRTLGESNSIRDSCLIAIQNKQTELETYKTLNDRIIDYDKLEHKLNETLGLLAQKEIDIKEGLKLKVYEISVVKEKHD